MSTRYKFTNKDGVYFITFAVVEWIDVFTRNDYRTIVVNSIIHCIKNKGLLVHGWVIMTNHVHLLISIQEKAGSSLSDITRDMKKYTAMHLIKNIRENPQESRKDWMLALFARAGKQNSNNTNYQFWRQDNHPILIKDELHFSQVLAYIHNNPANSGLVYEAINYPWSSAVDYENNKGLIPIEFF